VITTLPIFEKGSAERMIDQMRPQLVFIDAKVDGYSLSDVRSLREGAKFPLGVVGLATAGSQQLEAMLDVHLDAVFNLPLREETIEKMCAELPVQFRALAGGWGKGAWGADVPETIRWATAAAGASPWQRQVIGVWAPKGGVGKTTIACEIASMLAAIGGRKVALVDANMNGGHVRLRLNVDAPYGVLNAASAYHTSKGCPSLEADIPQRIEGLMTPVKGAPNLRVLAGVVNMEQSRHEHLAGEAGMEFARYLLPLLSRNYDFVIVDPGSSVNVGFHQGVLHEVDTILVVCEPDMTSISDVKEGVHRTVIQRIGIHQERFGLVINKWQENLGVSLQEAAKFANVSALGILPLDTTGNVTRAGNEGISYIAKYANQRKNPAQTEATMKGIAELAAQFYPPIGKAWSERLKNGRVRRGLGFLQRKESASHA
jgi:Flp pilus assembly CpaE family ATPase